MLFKRVHGEKKQASIILRTKTPPLSLCVFWMVEINVESSFAQEKNPLFFNLERKNEYDTKSLFMLRV